MPHQTRRRLLRLSSFAAGATVPFAGVEAGSNRHRFGSDEYVLADLGTFSFEYDAAPGSGTRTIKLASGSRPIAKASGFDVTVDDHGASGGGVDDLAAVVPIKVQADGTLDLSVEISGSGTIAELLLVAEW